ncbi:hypothetical protein [Actinoplanes solisilvae]|uniref:hypothetical protein n=1 Tax=Actinoplanes solisilvae TaxID=2486853 RepID=UPI0013E37285|nr:hypothetical protein [Actinoplanes solisilvae]
MVEDLPDMARHPTVAPTRRLPGGARVWGPDNAAVDLVAGVVGKTPQIAYIGQFTYAAPDYTVDTLADAALERPIAGLTRTLADNMVRLDAELSDAQTGRLIRIFLVADGGAAHCTEVANGRHLAGVTLLEADAGQAPLDAARRADSVFADLTNQLRRQMSQRPLDYGGWLAQAEIGSRPAPVDCSSGVTVAPRIDASDERAAEICLDHVGCRQLHYAAVYRQSDEIASVDVMHHPALDRFNFDDDSVEERRHFYAHFGLRIGRYLNDLTISAEPVIGPSVRHIVLDVERGALFFHRLDPSTYVVGVSLDQDEVATAELQIAALAQDLRT